MYGGRPLASAPSGSDNLVRESRGPLDVRCERCGTEYELDDLLLSPRGTAVRCGTCRHAFRVRPAPDAPTRWIVFRDDGLRLEVDSLGEICKRIRSGELAANDELARSAEGERRTLGAIDELRESFDHARTQRRPRPTFATEESARERTLVGGRKNQTIPAQLLEPGPEAYRPRSYSPYPGEPPASEPPQRPLRSSLPPPPTPRSPSDAPSVRPALRTEATTTPSRPVLSLAMDEELRGPRGISAAFVLGLVASVLLVLGVGTWMVHSRTAARERARADSIAETARRFARDTDDDYRAACDELGREHEAAPQDARVVAAIATCHARWAQMLRDEASFEPDSGRQATLRTVADEHAAESLRFATHALALDPRLAEAHVGRADALRLAGELDTAEAELRTAATLSSVGSAESLRVEAELAADRNPTASRDAVDRASTVGEHDARILVLLARVALAERNVTALDASVRSLAIVSPGHRGTAYLAAARSRLVPPEPPP